MVRNEWSYKLIDQLRAGPKLSAYDALHNKTSFARMPWRPAESGWSWLIRTELRSASGKRSAADSAAIRVMQGGDNADVEGERTVSAGVLFQRQILFPARPHFFVLRSLVYFESVLQNRPQLQ